MPRGGFKSMDKEKLKDAARRGGINSGASKRAKRDMKSALELLLSLKITKGKEVGIEEVQSIEELQGKNTSVMVQMLLAQIAKGLEGDGQAFALVRDTAGMKPDDTVNLSGQMQVTNPYDELTADELRALLGKCDDEDEKA